MTLIADVLDELAHHLASHHGLLTREQAAACGLTRGRFETMVRNHELARVHHGVYRHVAVPVTYLQSVAAAVLAAGGEAAGSHRTALAVHGAPNFSCSLIEITVCAGWQARRRGVLAHRSSTLSGLDTGLVDGVRVTTPARTLADACVVMSPTLVARYAQRWMADRVVHPTEIEVACRRAGNHTGARQLLAHLADVLDDGDSVPEAELGAILHRAGIPPVHHFAVAVDGGATFELDWAYPCAKVGLELDGYGVHLRSVEAFDRDRHRRNELELAGWRILNFTARQLRRPDRIVDQVRRALAMPGRTV